jgi:hypothetical protein
LRIHCIPPSYIGRLAQTNFIAANVLSFLQIRRTSTHPEHPNDLLQNHRTEWGGAQAVCHAWRAESKHALQIQLASQASLTLPLLGYYRSLGVNVANIAYSRIVTLDLREHRPLITNSVFSYADFVLFLSQAPHVTTLSIENALEPLLTALTHSPMKHLKSLNYATTINLVYQVAPSQNLVEREKSYSKYRQALSQFFQTFSKIEYLQWRTEAPSIFNCLDRVLSTTPSLTALDLTNSMEDNGVWPSSICEALGNSNIVDLTLSIDHFQHDGHAESLVPYLSKITQLTLIDLPARDDNNENEEYDDMCNRAMITLLTGCPRLLSLDLPLNYVITDETLARIGGLCPQLTRLNLKWKKVHNLQDLLSPTGILSVLQQCPLLISLDLTGREETPDPEELAMFKREYPRVSIITDSH